MNYRRITRATATGLAAFTAVAVVASSADAVPTSEPVHTSGKILATARVNGRMRVAEHRSSDVIIATITIGPHGSGGWHSHNGESIVSVTEGTATVYNANDPECLPHSYSRGQGFSERPHRTHVVRNERDVPLKLYVVSIVNAGQDPDIDEPRPADCPF